MATSLRNALDNRDMAGGRARKRLRSSSDPNRPSSTWSRRVPIPQPPAPPPPLVHDSEFWFEDGSVVLVANGIAFRVYKRLLAEHSPFFRTMFEIPQPPQTPTVEGTPCIPLADPPEQVRHLLRVLFPTNGYLTLAKREAPLSMDIVAAVVRLSHKYQMDHLLAQGLSLFMEQYTDNIDEWVKPGRALPIAARDIDAITAINIAHLTKTPSILPLAFLSASRTGTNVLRGCVRDGKIVERLTFPDMERALEGRPAWIMANSKALARIFAPEPSLDCTETRRCLKVLTIKARDLDKQLQRMYRSPSVITWAEEFQEEDDETGHTLCDFCRDMITARENDERQQLWELLPATFGLTVEGWSA